MPRKAPGCADYPGDACELRATLELYCVTCRKLHRYALSAEALDALLFRLESGGPSPALNQKENPQHDSENKTENSNPRRTLN